MMNNVNLGRPPSIKFEGFQLTLNDKQIYDISE